MKILCKIDTSEKNTNGFKPFKVAVQLQNDRVDEVSVGIDSYDKLIKIKHNKTSMYPKSLTFNCNNDHAAGILLSIEICKFVSESYPELRTTDLNRGK